MSRLLRIFGGFILKVLLFSISAHVLLSFWGILSSAPFVFDDRQFYHLDKILLYSFVYYAPFGFTYLIIFLPLKLAERSRGFFYASLIGYLAISINRYLSGGWWSRGMELDSREFYFLLLFVPPVIALLLKALLEAYLLIKKRRRSLVFRRDAELTDDGRSRGE